MAKGTVFREIRPWVGFKTGDIGIENMGGLPYNDSRMSAVPERKYIFTRFFAREGLSAADVGVAKGTIFQEIRPWVGYKTGDFKVEKLGGLP